MNIGFLDRRITFVNQQTTQNAYGELVGTPVDGVTVWAALDNKSANSSVLTEQDTSINVVTWRVRSSTDTRAITPKYKIRYGTDMYNILAVQEIGRNNELHFVSERVISE